MHPRPWRPSTLHTGRTVERLLIRSPTTQLTCLVSSLSASTCAPTDTACLCADQGFANVVTSCVTSNCTIRQSLVVKNYTASNCGLPEPNHDATLVAITVVLITLQTIFFALRMLCRAVRIAPWGWDDTTIVLAFVSCFGGSPLDSQLPGLTLSPRPLDPHHIVCRRFGARRAHGPRQKRLDAESRRYQRVSEDFLRIRGDLHLRAWHCQDLHLFSVHPHLPRPPHPIRRLGHASLQRGLDCWVYNCRRVPMSSYQFLLGGLGP